MKLPRRVQIAIGLFGLYIVSTIFIGLSLHPPALAITMLLGAVQAAVFCAVAAGIWNIAGRIDRIISGEKECHR